MRTELPPSLMNSKLYNAFWAFIWGLIINIVITFFIIFVLATVNYGISIPEGSSYFKTGITTMFFTVPFWAVFCLYKYKKVKRHIFYAYLLNLLLNVIFLTVLSILERSSQF